MGCSTMKTTISVQYMWQLFPQLNGFRSDIREIPVAFLSDDINNLPRPRQVGVDVNRFLEFFDKITLREGMILDYTYYFSGLGGGPLIYTRYEDAPNLSAREYIERFNCNLVGRTYIDDKPYLKDIIIDNDPESFFQLVVFSQVAHQFYLSWHARYNDHQFVPEPVLVPIRDIREAEKYRTLLDHISFEPLIEINDVGAEVRCVMSSEWIGVYYSYFIISWPRIAMDTKREVIVPYDCGIRF